MADPYPAEKPTPPHQGLRLQHTSLFLCRDLEAHLQEKRNRLLYQPDCYPCHKTRTIRHRLLRWYRDCPYNPYVCIQHDPNHHLPLEHDYGLLVSEDQYESDHAHANALQRLRCDLVTLNKLFARRDSLTHPDAEPHRTVTTTPQGQNCYTYHVERPFSAEEAFILAKALAHSRLADPQEKEQLLEK